MNKYHKTLWMGNIESWMTYAYLTSYLNSIQIFPQRITLKNPSNKRGCAFLEFSNKEQAEFVLNNFNGKKIKNLELKFNWVKTLEEKYSTPKMTKFTVSKRKLSIFNQIYKIQLFIGNIDKSIDFIEVKKYFYSRYNSIISIKLITNHQTGRSKGYGFIEFTNYKEFQTALSQKDPIIFGKQKLVFNSAKNKYDIDEENDLSNKIKTNSENNSFNENESCDTAISNAIISRDSNSSNISNNNNQNNQNSLNNINMIINTNTQLNNNFNSNTNTKSFLKGNNKFPDVKKIYSNTNEERKDLLSLHIKQALSKMKKEYFLNNINTNYNSYRNKYNYCEYYFSSGINKIWENNDENL